MRVLPIAAALLLALALPVPAQTSPLPSVKIVEILSDPDTATGQREFIELRNVGNTSLDLLGWKVRDAPTTSGSVNTFTFPAWRLGPGERVVVWGGGTADAYGPAWSNSAVWNNAGDGVNLLDAANRLVDWVGYGTTTPPAEMAGAPLQAKPDKGRSLAFDAAWTVGEPTPGLAPGGSGSLLSLQVANAPPTAQFTEIPASARAGGSLNVALGASDPNGASDLASWSVAVDGIPAIGGNGPPPSSVVVPMPTNRSTVGLVLTVRDQAGLPATSQATIALRWSDLDLILPADLGWPDLVPGTTVTSTSTLRIVNSATGMRVPRLDLGSLRGPGEADLAGRVEFGIVNGNTTQWVPYGAPLAALTALAPGQAIDVYLRLHVPSGLPAGRYGASLAVAT